MESEELKNIDQEEMDPPATTTSTHTHIVTADSVQAEDVPTIPLGSLQTISTLQPEVSVHSVASTRVVSTPTPLVVQPSEYKRSFSEWIQVWRDGIRPAYLTLPIMPVIVGSILGWAQTVSTKTPLGQFHPLPFIGALIAVLLLQSGASLVNDYYDYLRGIDTSNALGPGGLIQQGLIKPVNVLIWGFVLLAVGTLVGLVVAMAGGLLVYLIGLVGVLCAYFYSASARALSSLMLGELVVFIVFGPLVTLGAFLLQSGGQISSTALIYSLPLGLIAAAVIHVNDMRDIEGDAHASKRTLVTFMGLRWSRYWYLALLLLAYGIIVAVSVPSGTPHWLLLTLWTLPTLVVAISGMLRTDAPTGLHLIMKQTLTLFTLFSLLLAIALIITALIPVLPHIPPVLLPI